MRVLGLDLSLHCGWAVIEDGVRIESGTIDHKRKKWSVDRCVEDYDAIETSYSVAKTAAMLELKYQPDVIYIEQTNGSSFRNSQKLLEFIHFAVLTCGFPSVKVRYIDTSRWKNILRIRLSKEQRQHNAAVKEKTAKGKITGKHLSVLWANQTFKLALKVKDNNEADALAVAMAGYLETQKIQPPENPDIDIAFQP